MNKLSLRTTAIVCLFALILGALGITAVAAEYVYDTPIDDTMWEDPNFDDPSTYAYSFAFVGDTQCLTIGDRLQGTDHLERVYKYIAGTAEERKLEHVFVLGDITEIGYWNDYNMVNAAKGWPTITEEWVLAQKAIFQLNGKVKYNLCRGNHDDYMMDDYFNVPEYTDQFKGEGGFYTEPNATYPKRGRNKEKNPTGAVYWSATTGAHDETIVNSWRTMELYGTKYLFITVDYNPSDAVAKWVDETLAKYPDHKAIITTHSYLNYTGEYMYETTSVAYHNEYQPQVLWEKVLSKHANVFMIVCGHATGANIPIYTINTGKNGNKVYQFLINPQTYDLKEARKEGEKGSDPKNHQDQGLVMYMNFSEDGNTVSLNYYSTLLNKFLKGANYTLDLSGDTNHYGTIDMASLSDYGQETPLITEQKTAVLDGVINEGEYAFSKTTPKGSLGKGSINSDISEYYSYDDDYIYYAAKIKVANISFNLHPDSSIYTVDKLNSDAHSSEIAISLGKINSKVGATGIFSKPVFNRDIYFTFGIDSSDGRSVYEIKISRDYLKNNGNCDNLLSYSLSWGNSIHAFKLSNDAKTFLKNEGVTNSYDLTYNYAYFGAKSEMVAEPETTAAPETEEIVDNTEAVDENTAATSNATSGCNSTLALTPIFFVATLAGTAVVIKKKKD